MTHEEHKKLLEIANNKKPWLVTNALKEYIASVVPENASEGQNEPRKGTWTDNQRKAFHKGCQELADYLNEHGKDMRAVLKHDVDIPWTKDTVKEFIFRPIMKAMFGYESHTELKKIEEVSKLWDVAMKHLGERVEVEYMEFPNDKQRAIEENQGYKLGRTPQNYEYPTNDLGEPLL